MFTNINIKYNYDKIKKYR